MKTIKRAILAIACALVLSTSVNAQDFSVGADLVSSYVWRGTNCGNTPAIQPGISYSTGGFEVGAWGSSSFDYNAGCVEADLYAGYSFDFGLGLTVTDYYFGGDWTDGDAHYFEPSLSYGIGDFSIMGAYMFGGGKDEADEYMTSDTYVEAGYAFGDVSVFLGAGNGQYSGKDDFAVANVGVTYSKEITITESFSLPMFGTVALNPSTGGFYTVVGISL